MLVQGIHFYQLVTEKLDPIKYQLCSTMNMCLVDEYRVMLTHTYFLFLVILQCLMQQRMSTLQEEPNSYTFVSVSRREWLAKRFGWCGCVDLPFPPFLLMIALSCIVQKKKENQTNYSYNICNVHQNLKQQVARPVDLIKTLSLVLTWSPTFVPISLASSMC